MKETAVSTTTLNMENFEKTVTGDGITLVDFWAEWCGPCKMFGPIFEQTSEENPDVTFAKVDTEAEQQLAGALGIMSIPTLMIFRDGIQLFSQAGALPKSALDDLLRQVRELDMDEIRRQVENHDGHDHDGHDHDGHDHDGHDHAGHDHHH
jgi:thioredoxin 1